MDIQLLIVLVLVLLRTSVKALFEHIRCTEQTIILNLSFVVWLSLSCIVLKLSIKPTFLFFVVIQLSRLWFAVNRAEVLWTSLLYDSQALDHRAQLFDDRTRGGTRYDLDNINKFRFHLRALNPYY